jgi:hypothetical protein
MTHPGTILDHLNPTEITPSGWINSIGLLAWCGVGAFFASKAVEGLRPSVGVAAAAFVALAYVLALAIHSTSYDE